MVNFKELVLSCRSKSKILKWHVKEGDSVLKEKVLATYIFTEKSDSTSNFIIQRKLKAKFNGKVKEIVASPNEEIAKGQVVARMEETLCEHNTIMKDMCCDCGADLRKEPGIPGDLNEPVTASLPVVHNILELKVSMKEAEKLAKYDELQLLRARKLVLVVDLDMTLIHTTVEPVPKGSKDVYSFTLPGHQYEYHTKLRPGARKFLQSISKFYELHIFTMGSRMYAHTVARCLDPDGKFFAHRIRSRDEFINSYSKFHDLKALFPCGDHMVCIIDDREDVWHGAPNLISVKPYKYFKGSDDINDPFKPENIKDSNKAENKENGEVDVTIIDESKRDANEKDEESEIEITKEIGGRKSNGAPENKGDASKDGTEETPNPGRVDLDDYLFYLDEILEKIHFSFYSTLDAVKTQGGESVSDTEVTKFCTKNTLNPDVRVIVPEIRRQTLKGCNLVFTGVIPTNIQLEASKPFKIAVSLGARVDMDIVKKSPNKDYKTTHVVAARHGTHKAHKAYKNPDIHLVNPSWLWCASERWELPDESQFHVPVDDKRSPVTSRQGTPQHNSFESNKLKKISPLVDGFELPGGYNPDNFLATFCKQDLEEMDKEVEELMGGDDDDDDDNDSIVTIGRDSKASGSSTSSVSRKRKIDVDESDFDVNKIKKKIVSQRSSSNTSKSGSESGSSESDSDSSSSSDEDSDDSDAEDVSDLVTSIENDLKQQ